jgi:hypothetical protein
MGVTVRYSPRTPNHALELLFPSKVRLRLIPGPRGAKDSVGRCDQILPAVGDIGHGPLLPHSELGWQPMTSTRSDAGMDNSPGRRLRSRLG